MPIADAIEEVDPDVVHVQHEYGIFGVDGRFLDLLAGESAVEGEQ